MKCLVLLIFLVCTELVSAQTTYFWRNDQNPANNASWQNTSPILFWNTTSNFAEIPPGGEIIAFDGNVGTTMTNNLNATNRYRFEFFPNNAASRTINGTTPNRFYDFSNAIPAIYNNSAVLQTINFPIEIGSLSTITNPAYGFEINAFNGDFNVGSSISAENATGQKVLVLMTYDNGNEGSGSIVVSGAITNGAGSVALLKRDANTATLTNSGNTYSGPTTINAGNLRLNPDANSSMSSEFRLNGGNLSTQGIGAGIDISTSGNLLLQANSTIHLASVKHTLSFSNSSAASWTSGATLTIEGWEGTGGLPGTAGQIFIGNSDAGLSTSQLAQITFPGFVNGAMLLESGELVPVPNNLPVEFLGMSASCNSNGSIKILWETASECMASHFVVQRSMDGENWSSLGRVEASGNSISRVSYSFLDETPNRSSLSYYRLVQYDFDGGSETFGPVSSWCDMDKRTFTLYPNPIEEAAQIAFFWQEAQTQLNLAFFDLAGNKVSSSKIVANPGNNLVRVDFKDIAKGQYVLVLSSESALIERFLISKK